jgi:p-hydroxybenzoate 3-monooxygenase
MRTQVGIVGAGPAGLLLSFLLRRAGIDCVILENRSRQYVIERVRAGLLEQGTVDLVNELGLGARLQREGLVHHGLELRFGGKSHRIALTDLTGKTVTIYGQNELVTDLIDARLSSGGALLFEAEAVGIEGLDGAKPRIRFRHDGREDVLDCDFVAGCDGFHGICRPTVAPALTLYDREYPFGWLGVLSESPPVSDELIYVNHERGFALFTMRSRTISRLYLQCVPDEDIDNWPDARIWEELHARLGEGSEYTLKEGPLLQKGVTPMRSFVAAPMRHGRLFLAGDSAHIVPPTGAKGLNLAVADVRVLAAALTEFYKSGSTRLIDLYSDICLRRVWKAQRFSWWMTSMLHRFEDHLPFDRRVQEAELDYVTGSRAGSTSLAENYVGLPFEDY